MNRIVKKVINEYKTKRAFFPFPKALFYTLNLFPVVKNYSQMKHRDILDFIGYDVREVIDKYKDGQSQGNISKDCPIWVLWWQGVDSPPPPPVRKCIDSIIRQKGEHPVIVLNKENYKEYVNIPAEIVDKLVGVKNYTTLSDVIRAGLLSQNGGIWLDATLYVSKTITTWDGGLYSVRHEVANPRYVLDGWRWSAYMWACPKGAILPSFLFDAFCCYYKKHDVLIDYFLVDYLIATLYMNNRYVRQQIDGFPCDNFGANELAASINSPYDARRMEEILDGRRFHKLNWRMNIKLGDTMFAHLP